MPCHGALRLTWVAATGRLIHRDKILGRRLTIPAWFEIILNALAFAQINQPGALYG